MAASIPLANCVATGTRVAALAVAILTPMVGGGGGPLLDDAARKRGACV